MDPEDEIEAQGVAPAEEVDADPELILGKLDAWLDGLFVLLPNIAVALVVLALFVAAGLAVAWSIRHALSRRDREDLGTVTGSLLKWLIWIAGAMLALTIVTPSLRLGDLIAGLGIGSLAIGFAFKDILQNMFAGLLILIRRPFLVGDQIVASGYEGTVEHIQTRATLIRTYDGRRVVIPNSDVFTSAVTVNTAWEVRRSEYDFGIAFDADTARALSVALDAVRAVDGVRADPAPEALARGFEEFRKTVRLRWWTASTQRETLHVFSAVIVAVERAFAEAGIAIPLPIRTVRLEDERAASRRHGTHRAAE
jgi:small-conductance mechanosensitive channel